MAASTFGISIFIVTPPGLICDKIRRQWQFTASIVGMLWDQPVHHRLIKLHEGACFPYPTDRLLLPVQSTRKYRDYPHLHHDDLKNHSSCWLKVVFVYSFVPEIGSVNEVFASWLDILTRNVSSPY